MMLIVFRSPADSWTTDGWTTDGWTTDGFNTTTLQTREIANRVYLLCFNEDKSIHHKMNINKNDELIC